jgi:hypothetical protein
MVESRSPDVDHDLTRPGPGVGHVDELDTVDPAEAVYRRRSHVTSTTSVVARPSHAFLVAGAG